MAESKLSIPEQKKQAAAQMADRLVKLLLFPIRSPNSIQNCISSVTEKLQPFYNAAIELRQHMALYRPEDFPGLPHRGPCGPEAGCDGDCASAAAMVAHNEAIRAFDKALAEVLR